MLTTGLIQLTGFQFTLNALHIRDTALPQSPPFSLQKQGTMAKADNLKPGILQQSINIH